jgi:hypothetical protein
MSDDLEQRIIRLSAQHAILRDFVVWLLAREIGRSSDPNSTIRLASEFADTRVHGLPADTLEDLRISEVFQGEKDWIIAAASKVLR